MVTAEQTNSLSFTDTSKVGLPDASLQRTPDFSPKPQNTEILTQQDLYASYSSLSQQEGRLASYITGKIAELEQSGILSSELSKKLQYQFSEGLLSGLSALALVEKLGSSVTDNRNLLCKISAEDASYILSLNEKLQAQGVQNASQNIEAALMAGGAAMIKKHEEQITSGSPLVFSTRLDTPSSLNSPGFAGVDVAGALRTGLFTAPSERNGGSAEFHIDTKFARDLSMEEKVALMDQIARGYQAQGRRVEFSNSSVGGEVYNANDSYEKKAAILQRAFAAHEEHSAYGNWQSIDYYVPLNSDPSGRSGSSVEGVEMLAPNVAGANIVTSIADGYGKFMELVDATGKTILKTGHGDTAK